MKQPKAYLKKEGYTVEVEMIDFINKIITHENLQEDYCNDTEPRSVTEPKCVSKFEDIEFVFDTGFKDKNGVEIYTGDIIKHQRDIYFSDNYNTGEPSSQNRRITRIVMCHKTNTGIYFTGVMLEEFDDDDKKNYFTKKWQGKLTCLSEYSEVIGNKYDNPERLKEESIKLGELIK